jgi:hypothetical protein
MLQLISKPANQESLFLFILKFLASKERPLSQIKLLLERGSDTSFIFFYSRRYSVPQVFL